MARTQAQDEPVVRKSLLIVAGAAAGAALIGFVLMNFVFGGGGDTAATSPAPAAQSQTGGVTAPVHTATPTANNEVTSGGRDPFAPQGLAAVPAAAPAAPAAAAPAAPAPSASVLASQQVNPNPHFTLNVVKVYGSAADVKFDDKSIEGVHAGDKLPSGVVVKKVADGCAAFDQGGKTFSVCQGQTVKR
jgi:hypothetical protein